MSARKRKRPDRCSGALLSCHAIPLDACVQRQRRHCIGREAAEDKGHHHVVARRALPLESVRFLLGLQERCSPDELDDTTATFAGRGKRVWTLWPHCMGSSVNATAAGQARLAANQILDALAACPACGALAADHTVHEVSMLAYVGAGAGAPVHKDSALPGTSRSPHRGMASPKGPMASAPSEARMSVSVSFAKALGRGVQYDHRDRS